MIDCGFRSPGNNPLASQLRFAQIALRIIDNDIHTEEQLVANGNYTSNSDVPKPSSEDIVSQAAGTILRKTEVFSHGSPQQALQTYYLLRAFNCDYSLPLTFTLYLLGGLQGQSCHERQEVVTSIHLLRRRPPMNIWTKKPVYRLLFTVNNALELSFASCLLRRFFVAITQGPSWGSGSVSLACIAIARHVPAFPCNSSSVGIGMNTDELEGKVGEELAVKSPSSVLMSLEAFVQGLVGIGIDCRLHKTLFLNTIEAVVATTCEYKLSWSTTVLNEVGEGISYTVIDSAIKTILRLGDKLKFPQHSSGLQAEEVFSGISQSPPGMKTDLSAMWDARKVHLTPGSFTISSPVKDILEEVFKCLEAYLEQKFAKK